MIPDGTYAAVVVPVQKPNGPAYCEFGESGKKKTPMVTARFEMLRGPYAGQMITWYGYFSDTEGVAERTIKALRACGFRSDDFAGMVTEEVRQEFEIVVEQEEYNGRWRPRVKWVNAVAAGLKVENQMSASALRLFSTRFEKTLKATGVVSEPEAVRETPAPAGAPDDTGPGPSDDTGNDAGYGPPPGSGDDIPF